MKARLPANLSGVWSLGAGFETASRGDSRRSKPGAATDLKSSYFPSNPEEIHKSTVEKHFSTEDIRVASDTNRIATEPDRISTEGSGWLQRESRFLQSQSGFLQLDPMCS